MDSHDFHFKHPTTIQVSGLTLCGKTRLVRRILEEQLIQPFATRIIWVYSEWQPDYDMIREQYPSIEFEKGWRDEIFDSLSLEQRNILVLDDQMGVVSSSKSVADLFNRGSHHRNLTVIYLVQYNNQGKIRVYQGIIDVYNQGKSQRTISLYSHYSVVFRNGQDASQFRTMAHQICLSDGQWLGDAFTVATFKPYGYLVMDHHPSTPDDQTVSTNILPGEPLTYYIMNNSKFRRY